jgi:hypothetical protein
MEKKIFLGIMLAMLMLFGTAESQASIATPDIGFDPVTQDVALGNSANVNLYFSQVVDIVSLGAFDLDISFDPSILSFSSIAFGDPVLGDQLDIFGLGSVTGSDASTPGIFNLFEFSLDDPLDLENLQAGSFILATLTFDTLTSGTSPLSLSVNAIGDAYGDPFSVDLVNGRINVIGVPEPATLILMGSGLAGLGLWRRRRDR